MHHSLSPKDFFVRESICDKKAFYMSLQGYEFAIVLIKKTSVQKGLCNQPGELSLFLFFFCPNILY